MLSCKSNVDNNYLWFGWVRNFTIFRTILPNTIELFTWVKRSPIRYEPSCYSRFSRNWSTDSRLRSLPICRRPVPGTRRWNWQSCCWPLCRRCFTVTSSTEFIQYLTERLAVDAESFMNDNENVFGFNFPYIASGWRAISADNKRMVG